MKILSPHNTVFSCCFWLISYVRKLMMMIINEKIKMASCRSKSTTSERIFMNCIISMNVRKKWERERDGKIDYRRCKMIRICDHLCLHIWRRTMNEKFNYIFFFAILSQHFFFNIFNAYWNVSSHKLLKMLSIVTWPRCFSFARCLEKINFFSRNKLKNLHGVFQGVSSENYFMRSSNIFYYFLYDIMELLTLTRQIMILDGLIKTSTTKKKN